MNRSGNMYEVPERKKKKRQVICKPLWPLVPSPPARICFQHDQPLRRVATTGVDHLPSPRNGYPLSHNDIVMPTRREQSQQISQTPSTFLRHPSFGKVPERDVRSVQLSQSLSLSL